MNTVPCIGPSHWQIYGWMDRWVGGFWTDWYVWIGEWADGWTDGQTNTEADRWRETDRAGEGWGRETSKSVDGFCIDGWMDGRTDKYRNRLWERNKPRKRERGERRETARPK